MGVTSHEPVVDQSIDIIFAFFAMKLGYERPNEVVTILDIYSEELANVNLDRGGPRIEGDDAFLPGGRVISRRWITCGVSCVYCISTA